MTFDDDSHIKRLIKVREEEDGLLKKLIEERYYLVNNSRIDTLTGLFNRSVMKKIRKIGAVIMCDIDNFKSINDTYGHAKGDYVIRTVAEKILNSIRIEDVAIRYGGDEFLVFMSRMSPEKFYLIERKVKQINLALREFCEGKYNTFSVSVGVSFSKSGYNEKMFPEADSALYYVKEHGRAGLAAYSPMMAIRKAKL